MPRYLSLGNSLLFLSLRVGIGWAWFRLFSRRQQLTPKWRAGIFVVGLFFATVSTVLSSFLFVHAAFTGGYTFYHPVELALHSIWRFDGIPWNTGVDCRQRDAATSSRRTLNFEFINLACGRYGPVGIVTLHLPSPVIPIGGAQRATAHTHS
jgi:hypothetical protein